MGHTSLSFIPKAPVFEVPEAYTVTDAAVMRLPHPARMVPTMGPFFGALEKMLGAEWATVTQELLNDANVLPEVLRRLTVGNQLPRFTELLLLSSGMPGGTEQGGPLGLMAYLRHRIRPAPHFVIDDALVHILEHTDIAEDIPLSMFNLPFSRFYVELGQARDVQCTIPNMLSGDHILEGAYVERGHHVEGDVIYLVLTGSPLGKADATDDATLSIVLPLADLDKPIPEVILQSYRHANERARPMGLALSPESWTKDTLKAILLLAKALLYIGMPGTRRELHPEHSSALKALKAVKSTAKRAKALRRAAKMYDYILVGPQPEHAVSALASTRTGSMRSHWRRGHYRLQAHGVQHQLRKLIFIAPMLVGAQAGQEVQAQNYRVV